MTPRGRALRTLGACDRSPDMPVIGVCSAMEPARWSVWDLPGGPRADELHRAHPARGRRRRADPAGPGARGGARPGARSHRRADAGRGRRHRGATSTARSPIRPPTRRSPCATPSRSALVREAASRESCRVLGICRGAQVINVAAGRDAAPAPARGRRPRGAPARRRPLRRQRARRAWSRRARVRATPPARARTGWPPTTIRRSADLGEALAITARSEDDLARGRRVDGPGWVLGVQWHPEADPDSGVIAALVRTKLGRRREDVDREEGGGLLDPRRSP